MHGNCLGEPITVSSGNVELIPSEGGREASTTVGVEAAATGGGEATSAEGGKATSTGKEDSSEFRDSIPPVSSVSSHTSPSQLIGSISRKAKPIVVLTARRTQSPLPQHTMHFLGLPALPKAPLCWHPQVCPPCQGVGVRPGGQLSWPLPPAQATVSEQESGALGENSRAESAGTRRPHACCGGQSHPLLASRPRGLPGSERGGWSSQCSFFGMQTRPGWLPLLGPSHPPGHLPFSMPALHRDRVSSGAAVAESGRFPGALTF